MKRKIDNIALNINKAKQLAKEMVIYDDDLYSELTEALDCVLGAKSIHFWWD